MVFVCLSNICGWFLDVVVFVRLSKNCFVSSGLFFPNVGVVANLLGVCGCFVHGCCVCLFRQGFVLVPGYFLNAVGNHSLSKVSC